MEKKINDDTYIPISKICILQFLGIIATGFLLFEITINRKEFVVFIIILGILLFGQLLLVPLSFLLWNRPLKFNYSGFFKGKKFYCWNNIIEVKYIYIVSFAHHRLIIKYADGSRIKVQPTKLFEEYVFKFCKSEFVIDMFKKALEKTIL